MKLNNLSMLMVGFSFGGAVNTRLRFLIFMLQLIQFEYDGRRKISDFTNFMRSESIKSEFCHRPMSGANILSVRKFHVAEKTEKKSFNVQTCVFYGWRGSRSNKLWPVTWCGFVYRFALALYIGVTCDYFIHDFMHNEQEKIATAAMAIVVVVCWWGSRKFALDTLLAGERFTVNLAIGKNFRSLVLNI
jgi:hypothetical protein